MIRLRAVLVFAFLGLLGTATPAQAALQLNGQFRNLLFVPQLDGQASVADSNGVRLDLQAATGANELLRFRGSIDLWYAFGSARTLADGAGLTGPEGIPAERLHLDLFRAFVQLRTPHIEAFLGRQRIAWGTGLFLRPTDAFEPNDLFDPYRELAGVDALRLMLPVTQAVYLDGVARIDTLTSKGQLGLAAGIRNPDALEASLNLVLDSIHGREQLGLAFKGSGPVRYWLDAVYRHQSSRNTWFDDENQMLLEAGLEYTLPVKDGLSLAGEYLRLSSGDPSGGGDKLADAIADYRVLQGRDYGYLLATLAVRDRLNASLGLLVNIDDGSTALLPRVTGRPLDTLELSLGAEIYLGRGGTEFARSDLPDGGRGAALYYLLTTWYF